MNFGANNLRILGKKYVLVIFFALLLFFTISFVAPQTIANAEPVSNSENPTWVDKNTITVGPRSYKYDTKSPSGTWVFKYSESYQVAANITGSCDSKLTFTSDPYADNGGWQADNYFQAINSGSYAGTGSGIVTCKLNPNGEGSVVVYNASAVNSNQADSPSQVSAAPASPTGTSDDEGMTDCDATGNPISWFVCPVIDGFFATIRGLDGLITKLMVVDTENIYSNSDTSKAYHQAWSSFRTMALALVIIASLIIVIASAFGFDFLDAYTIKKALPRVFIAVIGIAISWQATEFFINLSNDAGIAVRYIIYAPFTSLDAYAMSGGTKFIALFAFSVSLWVWGWAILLFLVTAAIGVIIALLILVVREMIILFCVIIAPVAIVCYILPNTEKFWKLWSKTFIALLIVFPIISGFIAIGRVFSAIAYSNGSSGVVNNVIAFIAYFLPYFLIPVAFKMAGGVMATLAGVGNDRSRGVFDRLSKTRQKTAAKNVNDMKSGSRYEEHGTSRYNPGRWATRAFNRTTVGLGTGFSGRFGVGSVGREAIDQKRRNAMAEYQRTPEAMANKENDDALRAQTYRSAAEATRDLEVRWAGDTERVTRAVNAAKAGGGFGKVQQLNAAQALTDTGTGYTDYNDMVDTIARVSEGDESTVRALAGYNNFMNKQKGRHDLAPGAGNVRDDVRNYVESVTANGAAPAIGPRRTRINNPGHRNHNLMHEEVAWNSGSLYQVSNGKAQATENFARTYLELMQSNDAADRERAAIAFMEMQSALPGASGENQRIFNEALAQVGGVGIDHNSGVSIEEQLAAIAGTGITASRIRGEARVYDQQTGQYNTNLGGNP